jgi:hypothetical protein
MTCDIRPELNPTTDQIPRTGFCLGYIGWLTAALITLCDLLNALVHVHIVPFGTLPPFGIW